MSLKLASLTEADVSLPVLPGVAVGILDEGSLEVPDGQGTSEVSVLPQRDTALPIRLLLGVQGTAAPYKVLCGGGGVSDSPHAKGCYIHHCWTYSKATKATTEKGSPSSLNLTLVT